MKQGSKLQERLDAALKRSGLPAMAAAVVTADSIETAVGGVRRKGDKAAVTLADRWHLGSNTKAMTATMLGLLVQDGRLSWDATPASVWPGLSQKLTPQYRDITLRQLIQHRAGIQPFTDGREMHGLPEFPSEAPAMRQAFAEHVLSGKPHGKPGVFEYSNAGYGIAAAMAETATGIPYDELMQAELLQPLGLDGLWGWPARQPGQPWGHAPGLFGRLQPNDPRGDYQLPDYIAPAGNLSMSIGDYSVFVQAHLRGMLGLEPLNKAGQPIAEPAAGLALNAALIKQLHECEDTYSYGWGEMLDGEQPTSMHEGSAGTFDVLTIIQPDRGRATVVFCNAGGEKASAAVKELCQDLLSEAE